MYKTLKKNWLFFVYFLFFGIFFARVWSIALFMDDLGLRSGWISSWADGAAHLSFMSTFAYRDSFPTQHPLFIGKSFNYPYVADMLGALLVRMGMPLYVSYNLMGFLLSMFLVTMVWKLYKRLFEKEMVAIISGMVFFFGAGLTAVGNWVDPSLKSIFDTYDWVDVISAQIMPQRALILGMPVGILIFLWIFDFYQNKKISNCKLFCTGLLTGLMSMIHVHSLMALFFVISFLFVADVWKGKKIRSGWIWYGVPAVVVGVSLVLRQVGQFDRNFFSFLPFWLVNSKDDVLWWFWIKSWGVWPIIAFLGFKKINKNTKIVFYPFLLLFVTLNMFTFQPYDWDNTKLFLWIYLFFSGVVGYWLVKTYGQKRWLVGGVFLMLIFSGLIDASKLLIPQDDPVLYLFSFQDMEMMRVVREKTLPNSVFVTSNYHLNPIPVLTGRQILMGYPGWLWTYGIDYIDREWDVESIYSGGDRARALMNDYGVDFVVFDGIVNGTITRADETYFEENFEMPGSSFIALTIGLAVLGLVGLYLFNRILNTVQPENKWIRKIQKLWTDFKHGLSSVLKVKNLPLFVFNSIGIWLMYYLMTYLCFFAFEPTSHLGGVAGLVVFVFGTLGIVLPSPGGIGSYQWLVGQALVIYGIDQFDAFSFSNIMFFAIQIFCNIIFGFFFLIFLPYYNSNKTGLKEKIH